MTAPFIVGLGGTLREGSSTELALRYALAQAEALGATTALLTGGAIDLPTFAPGRLDRTAAATHLVATLRRADGVIVASPGYHGGISGMVKNALDYTEDMREDALPYFEGRAVGCIVTAAGWQATGSTLAALRSVVHALRGWPSPLGVTINSTEPSFAPGGLPLTPAIASQLTVLAQQVTGFALRARPST